MEREADARAADPSGGANQARVRAYNERLVLSLVRRHGALSRADIARLSGLTAQAVSVIIRALERDGLLRRGPLRRGKVGQPSTPMHLDPDGAVALGLEIGRRGATLLAMDFAGRIRGERRLAYRWPEPRPIRAFVAAEAGGLLALLPPALRARCAGLGVAMPFELWNWEAHVGAPAGAMAAWREADLGAELAAETGLPVSVRNDGTAACGAELALGGGAHSAAYAYFFVGFFVGGGIVLDHAVQPGRTGNAGALGSLRVAGQGGGSAALLDEASLFLLEAAGRDAAAEAAWLDRAAPALADAMLSAAAVLDVEAIVLDGAMAPALRARLVAAVRAALACRDASGISPFRLEEGRIGGAAPAMGAALLPLMERYLLDMRVLLKPPA